MLELKLADAPRWQRGHLEAHVEASEPGGILATDPTLVHVDSVVLNVAKSRAAFAAATVERHGNGTKLADVEQLLLGLYQNALQAQPQPADPDEGGRAARESVQIVRQLAGTTNEFFHSPGGEPFATVTDGAHRITFPLRAAGFRRWVSRAFYLEQGTVPTGQAVTDALANLEAQALWAGKTLPVYTRVAPADGGIILDLADESWDAIELTAEGWRVVNQPPVKFRRTEAMLPLPRPQRGGTLDELRQFLRLQPGEEGAAQLQRLLAFWVDCYRPGGPYGILTLTGPEGSGKSTLTRILRRLVDPNQAPTRRPPRDERTLFIAAQNSGILAFSNLSSLPGWLSDALCSITSGEAQAERRLHTDSDESLFTGCCPVIINSIEEVGNRADFLDRCVTLRLPRMPKRGRRAEKQFWQAFTQAEPRLLGMMLDAVSTALALGDNVQLGDLPRLADTAHWAGRALTYFDYDSEQVVRQFHTEGETRHSRVLEASTLATVLEEFVRGQLDGTWSGTVGALLAELNEHRGDKRPPKHWPADAIRLSGQLSRLESALSSAGIQVEFGRRTNKGQTVTLRVGDPPTDDGPPENDPLCETPPAREDTCNSSSPSSPSSLLAPELWSGSVDERVDSRESSSPLSTPCRASAGKESDVSVDSDDDSRPRLQGAGAVAPPYTVLHSPADVAAALPALFAADWLGLDCETARADGLSDAEEARARTALDPRRGRLRLVQLATRDHVYLLDAFACDPRTLTEVFTAGPRLIGHNLRFDLQFLAAAGLPVPPGDRLFDTQVVSQLLDAGIPPEKGRHTLKSVAARYLNRALDKSEQTSNWGGVLTDTQLAYAAEDAAVLVPLALALGDALTAADLWPVARLEMRALPAVVWLEQTGAPFATEAWCALSDAAVAEQLRLEQALTEESGQRDLLGAGTVNWGSPAQVVRLLQTRGHAVQRADEETLCLLADQEPLARLLLDHREATKRAGTYGITWAQRHVHPTTGRVHANWLQLGSRAGRMSCTDPNLQQVPRTPAYRACFRPPAGRVFVIADYSQVELRIAAQICGDATMRAAYQVGADLHARTAATVLGCEETAVTKEQRQLAKALNFGLQFGMGAKTLRAHAARDYGVQLSETEADRFRQKFFQTYPGLHRWHREHAGDKAAPIETRTLAGRRRQSVAKFTEQVNTPVQGTGADGLKAALALLWERRDVCRTAVPVFAVHDEVVVEVDATDADAVRAWLVSAMEDGMQPLLPDVPVVVESAIGADWSAKA
jgi:DNA polymerase-1